MAYEKVCNTQILFDCCNEIEKYKCKTCPNFQTNLSTKLRSHVRDGHGDEILNEYIYKCLKCLFVTHSKYVLRRHTLFSKCATNDKDKQQKICYQTNAEHNFRLDDEPPTMFNKNPEIDYFKCEHCTSTFNQISSLLTHIQCVHAKPDDIQWFECGPCGSKFKTESGLKMHIIARHQKPEFLHCEQCSSKFRTINGLKQHLKIIHSKPDDIKWYQCEECSVKCKAKWLLARHIKWCHSKPEDIRWFQCELCTYKSKSNAGLRVHFVSRHVKPEDIDWHQCEECLFKFKLRSDLLAHIKRHGTKVHAIRPEN